MDNGAVYSPTTEAAPGAGRGARSGLAAYFFLGRLPWSRRVLKVLQLVRPTAAEDEREPGRGSGQGRGQGGGLWTGEAAARPSRSGSSRFHTPVPSLPTREGGVAVRLLPVAPPQSIYLSLSHRKLFSFPSLG